MDHWPWLCADGCPVFHRAGEIDTARRIAERALSTIVMTAERDKFNVWVALMNLEDAYGGDRAEESVMAVFNRYGNAHTYLCAHICPQLPFVCKYLCSLLSAPSHCPVQTEALHALPSSHSAHSMTPCTKALAPSCMPCMRDRHDRAGAVVL